MFVYFICLGLLRRQWHPTPVLLPGKSHGRRSLEGCSPWGRWGSDTTEWLHFHFSLSCIGEGNGNPLQCSCLENPRDGGAWWAAVYRVTQSQTRLKRLSSSRLVYYLVQWFFLNDYITFLFFQSPVDGCLGCLQFFSLFKQFGDKHFFALALKHMWEDKFRARIHGLSA